MSNHYRVVKMADASNPEALKAVAAGASIIAGYIGGDTPHVWSESDWRRSEFRTLKKLPIFVRSQVVGETGGLADGWTALQTLYNLGVPKNTYVVYDRETNTDKEATTAFGNVITWGGYLAMTYGSRDNLFSHPGLNGYWVADPTGVPHMNDHPGVNATQYVEDQGGFDYSEFKFWAAEFRLKVWA